MFFDSLGKLKPSVLKEYSQILTAFVQNEILKKSKKRTESRRKEVKMLVSGDLPILNPAVPPQTTSYDCGIFLLAYVDRFLKVPYSACDANRTF